MIACMGGWCPRRDRCQHYHAESPVIAERLCPPGEAHPVEVRGSQDEEEETLPPALRGGALETF